jgi:hypothetical protein
MPGQGGAWDRRRPLLPLLLMLAACWLLAHPWNGLWHDGRLYALQALHRLQPDNFRNDLFFLYGSQDSFTLFSPLYAAVINALGLPAAGLLLYVLGSLLWVAAAAFLLAPLLKGRIYWLGLAGLLLLPMDYGPAQGLLNLAEPFVTPRIFAEALSMLALGFLLRGQWRRGLPPLALAFLMHPLMAGAAALFGLLYLAKGRERGMAVAAALALGLLLAAAVIGIEPFPRLLTRMDDEWLALVSRLAWVHTWDSWQPAQWLSRTAVAFSVVLAAARLAPGIAARFFACLALTGALGLLATWAGTSLLHNLLLIQAQPWRTLWLLQLGSWIALAWLLSAYWQRGGVIRLLLLALVVGALTRNSIGGALAVPAAAMLCWQLRRPQAMQLPGSSGKLLAGLLLALGSMWLAEIVKHATDNGALMAAVLEDSAVRIWGWTLLKTGAAAVLGIVLMWLVWRWSHGARRGAYLLACLLALASLGAAASLRLKPQDYAFAMSDQARRDAQAAFLPLIPPQAVVYWENDVRDTWFLLQRSSYVSNAQLAGLAFNRGTALEGARRLKRLERLGMPDAVREYDAQSAKLKIAALPQPGLEGLRYVCADPVLDFVVLVHRFKAGIVAQVRDTASGRDYFLYDCALLRNYNPPIQTN